MIKTQVIGNCLICEKEFITLPSVIKKGSGKFCSRKCYGEWQSINLRNENHCNWKPKVKKVCGYCNKVFEVIPYIEKKGGGKFCSYKCRGKWLSKNLRGRNNPNWKGGITSKRTNYECKLWRKKVFERDHFTCLICGNVGGYLNAHHIKNWASHPELRYDIDNGMTMCQDCHDIVDKELPLFSIKI